MLDPWSVGSVGVVMDRLKADGVKSTCNVKVRSHRMRCGAVYQMKYWPKTSRVSLRSTFSNGHVIFGYLHCSVHASLNCTAIAQRACNVSSTDFRTTNLVDVNWTVTLINQRRLPPVYSWRHCVLFLQRTTMDANHMHRGGWTQWFQTAKVTLALAVPEIWLPASKLKMGHVTLTTPLLGVVYHLWLDGKRIVDFILVIINEFVFR